ncbi:hypothetical protein PIB30_054919 [Stylosanthes scabra]|uniref:Uncharacterized protein n=1 Tax=Stylosanthes scabra TaxID=79078 RepID=A0ABU6VHD2_9FABA|nr:hypothetical protein [Stylosanthes scabra]
MINECDIGAEAVIRGDVIPQETYARGCEQSVQYGSLADANMTHGCERPNPQTRGVARGASDLFCLGPSRTRVGRLADARLCVGEHVEILFGLEEKLRTMLDEVVEPLKWALSGDGVYLPRIQERWYSSLMRLGRRWRWDRAEDRLAKAVGQRVVTLVATHLGELADGDRA